MARGRSRGGARSAELGRLPPLAPHAQDRAGRRPGRASAVRDQPDVSARALRARAPDLGHERRAAPLARHAGVVGVVGALLGLRAAGAGARSGRPRLLPVLVRPLRRLLGGLRGRAGARGPGDPRRRPGLGAAPGRRWRPWARPRSSARRPTRCTWPRWRASAASTCAGCACGRPCTRVSRGPASRRCGPASRRRGGRARSTTRA